MCYGFETETKWTLICRRHFLIHFVALNLLWLDSNFKSLCEQWWPSSLTYKSVTRPDSVKAFRASCHYHFYVPMFISNMYVNPTQILGVPKSRNEYTIASIKLKLCNYTEDHHMFAGAWFVIFLLNKEVPWITHQNLPLIVASLHSKHDDVIKWKQFLRYWSLWGESTEHLVDSIHKGQFGVAA